jgi:DNA-binding response OmpR family regulator
MSVPRILVIDDDERQGRSIARLLSDAGYEVVVAADGDQGLEKFRLHPADLVITDLVMPVKNGLQFMIELHRSSARVPVIVMSAGGLSGGINLELASETGAARVLVKPFGREELIAAVKEVLGG